jgi:hypothetical protein
MHLACFCLAQKPITAHNTYFARWENKSSQWGNMEEYHGFGFVVFPGFSQYEMIFTPKIRFFKNFPRVFLCFSYFFCDRCIMAPSAVLHVFIGLICTFPDRVRIG